MIGALRLLLQATPTVDNPISEFNDGGLMADVLGFLTTAFGGESMFGLLVGGCTLFVFWIAGKGDLATPTVLLILFGGVLWPILPGAYVGFARSLLIIGIAAAFLAIARRYVMNPGVR